MRANSDLAEPAVSLVQQIIGKTASTLQTAFLNYLAGQTNRARTGVILRVGGNTQDQSTYVASQEPAIISSGASSNSSASVTPNLSLGPELFAVLQNVTTLVNANWIVGLNFAAPQNDSNAVAFAGAAEQALGSSLKSFQLGNEPDLYSSNGKRPSSYSIPAYIADFATEVRDINSSSSVSRKSIFAGPNVCCDWQVADILSNGYLADFSTSLNAFAVQHCA